MSKNTKVTKLNEEIRELIDNNPDLNMSKLGKVLGVTPQAARQRLILSDLSGNYKTLVKIAEFVGKDVDELFG